MLKAARELFPAAGNYDKPEYWAGLRPMTPDNLPIFGRGRLRQPVGQYRPRPHGLDLGLRLGPDHRRPGRRPQAGARRHHHARALRAPWAEPDDRSHIPHQLDGGLGARARIGLIVLATDQTIEHEWRLIFRGLDGVALLPEPDLERRADHARDADAHGGQARRERRRHHARPAAGRRWPSAARRRRW